MLKMAVFVLINTIITSDDAVIDKTCELQFKSTDGKHSLAAYATSEEEVDYVWKNSVRTIIQTKLENNFHLRVYSISSSLLPL